MKPSSAKNKGRLFQKQVAKLLTEELGLDEGDIVPRSSGANGEDLMMSPAARKRLPVSVECKHVQALNVHEAFRQAQQNAGPHFPAVIFRRNRDTAKIMMDLTDFLQLIKGHAHAAD